MFKNIFAWIKKEIVFCVTFIFALISVFFVPLSKEYFSYIDFNTLFLLFALMTLTGGWRRTGLFDSLGNFLCSKFHSLRSLSFVLVMLCFFSSMFITNDVALLTFVPFALIVLKDISNLKKIFVIVLQTLAANLGSMLTPVGNPQNIFLYSKMSLSFFAFIKILLPYTVASFLMLSLCIIFLGNEKITFSLTYKKSILDKKNLFKNSIYLILFFYCLLTVAGLLPKWSAALVVFLFVLFLDRKVFFEVDFMLLLTFVAFFIFTGNISHLDAVKSLLEKITLDHEFASGILFSQLISNVPASLLLYPFARDIKNLLLGVNIGGLGTLVASLASLISFKSFTQKNEGQGLKYFLVFTVSNIVFLFVLIAVHFIFERIFLIY